MIFNKHSLLALMCLGAGHFASAEVSVEGGVATVSTLADLTEALGHSEVSVVKVTKTLELTNGTFLWAERLSDGKRKVVQVMAPFLPETGMVTLKANDKDVYNEIHTPAAGAYSTYNLFDIQSGSRVVISNLTLMGGFEGNRVVDGDTATTGGIDNRGHLVMHDTDILRTGTALLNRPNATVVLVGCNIVRNANWYGGGILNFAERVGDTYTDGGTVIMDRCSLTENQSLGPAHGGGAAENQGLMCLNNCVIANNASTEIGGGINN